MIDYIKQDNNIGVISLSKSDTEDKELMAIFDGFINPGAGDTFPTSGEFNLNYLGKEYSGSDHEYAYQNIINYVQEKSIPYLGLCNGAQHLILNKDGYIAMADIPHNGVPHTLKVEQGSIVQFLAMNADEQSIAVSQGYFPAMEFAINTQHNYAGVYGKIGTLELGGVSDAGVVEAVANNFYQVGFQFHPENMYNSMKDKVFGRNANLLKNIFKFFMLKPGTDLDKVHAYMQTEWNAAFEQAQCYRDEENSCPAPQGVIRDIFAEALEYSMIDGL